MIDLVAQQMDNLFKDSLSLSTILLDLIHLGTTYIKPSIPDDIRSNRQHNPDIKAQCMTLYCSFRKGMMMMMETA